MTTKAEGGGESSSLPPEQREREETDSSERGVKKWKKEKRGEKTSPRGVREISLGPSKGEEAIFT